MVAVMAVGGSDSEVPPVSATGGRVPASTKAEGVALVRSSASTGVVGASVGDGYVGASVVVVPVVWSVEGESVVSF
jgi:hypothetical protein